MKYLLAVSGLCVVLVMAATVPLFAHHSFAAEYDNNKPIKFTGKVTKVEWMNPHIYVYIDAPDASGKTVNYAVEGGAPNGLYRQGWRKDTLKVGDEVEVQGFAAKDGSTRMWASRVSWVNQGGQQIFGLNQRRPE